MWCSFVKPHGGRRDLSTKQSQLATAVYTLRPAHACTSEVDIHKKCMPNGFPTRATRQHGGGSRETSQLLFVIHKTANKWGKRIAHLLFVLPLISLATHTHTHRWRPLTCCPSVAQSLGVARRLVVSKPAMLRTCRGGAVHNTRAREGSRPVQVQTMPG